MSVSVQSLWSEEIRPNILSPKSILREQADQLTKLTNRTLIGELTRRNPDSKNKVTLSLDVIVPALNDYRHRILVAVHDKDMLYPVVVDADIFRPSGLKGISAAIQAAVTTWGQEDEKPANRADSDRELLELVKRVLRSPQVVSVAQSLIARANEVLTEKEHQDEADSASPREVTDVLPAVGGEPPADQEQSSEPLSDE